MIQHILSHKTWRPVVAMRAVLDRVTVPKPPAAAFCCCVLRLSPSPPASKRWLSTSVSSKAAQPRPEQQPPEEEPPQHSGSTPQTQASEVKSGVDAADVDPLQDTSIGLVQRFKRTFKQYGKVMIPVHLVTSSIWFGTFYYAAMKGVNVVPFLELLGLPESVVGLLRDSSSGYALTAYAMYKIATPARYTVTLGGTSLSVQYLRKHGYFSTPPPVKNYIQDRMEETKERFSEKMEETKERISEKMEETKDKFSEKLQETKDKVSEGKAFFRKKSD